MTFGKILRELRKERTFSAKNVAEYLGVSLNLIYEWEHERCFPGIDCLIKLSDFFGVSVDFLVGREDDLGNVNVNGAELPPAEQEILSLFRSLGPFEREAILIQMKALSENKIKQ